MKVLVLIRMRVLVLLLVLVLVPARVLVRAMLLMMLLVAMAMLLLAVVRLGVTMSVQPWQPRHPSTPSTPRSLQCPAASFEERAGKLLRQSQHHLSRQIRVHRRTNKPRASIELRKRERKEEDEEQYRERLQ